MREPSVSMGESARSKVEMPLLALILLLAAGLRFYRLAGSSLWSDEGNTWALLSRSFAQIAHDAAADIHPPGYYWLLKVWTMLVGADAWGMRSFSAIAGILLVYVIYRLGRQLETARKLTGLALLAALVAALNPLQIYYSQEARMYQILALESAGLFWALAVWQRQPKTRLNLAALGYVGCGIAGLWTHYSFPVIWGAALLGFMLNLLLSAAGRSSQAFLNTPTAQGPAARRRAFWLFVGLNLLILLAYLPWLPIAIDRVLHWPKGGLPITLMDGIKLTLQTLVFGPLRTLPPVQQPWLWGAALFPILGLLSQWRQGRTWSIGLWWLAPLFLMFGLGLFSEAFLKFLLAASPAWCLLTVLGILHLPMARFWRPLLIGATLALAVFTLPAYYASPTARDNYAGIAAYLQAAADPAKALVVLDAPGQQEVWRYYNPGLPFLALPQQRPPDSVATMQALRTAVAGREAIYALFWATDEADPDRLVERWLDQQAFKGVDSWQGNVRFVSYFLPTELQCTALGPAVSFGEAIQLTGLCRSGMSPTVAAGTVALVGLQWQALTALTQRYKVTVQVLDAQNAVIAQRDSEPVGGSFPTDQWPVGQPITDNHGILIPVGTPPGAYRLVVALYDHVTGARLRLSNADDYLALGELMVIRPGQPFPPALLSLQHPANRPLGPLYLVGYNAHRKDMAHVPDTPIVAGDVVEFTFFWQAPDPLPADWPEDLSFTLTLGDQTLTMSVAGEGYPTSQWQAGELVRSKAALLYSGGTRLPRLQIGAEVLRLQPLPGTSWWQRVY